MQIVRMSEQSSLSRMLATIIRQICQQTDERTDEIDVPARGALAKLVLMKLDTEQLWSRNTGRGALRGDEPANDLSKSAERAAGVGAQLASISILNHLFVSFLCISRRFSPLTDSNYLEIWYLLPVFPFLTQCRKKDKCDFQGWVASALGRPGSGINYFIAIMY